MSDFYHLLIHCSTEVANKSKLVLLCVALNLRLATLNFNAHLYAAARVPALLDSWSTSLPSHSQLPTYQQGGRSAAHQAAALEDDTWYPEFEVAYISGQHPYQSVTTRFV